MRGLSFMVDGDFFAADVTLVQKVSRNISVTPVPAAPDTVVGIANIKGKVVTILSLNALLGRNREKNEGWKAAAGMHQINAVIFKPFTDGGDKDITGLLIDKPGDLIDISENKILPPSTEEKQSCVSGMAEIDGKLYRIINIGSIIDEFNDGGEIPPE